MVDGITQVSQSLQAKMKKMEVIANNLANINTTGYKRELPFSEIVSTEGDIYLKQATDYQQGELINSSNPMDLAISGRGFFTVKNDNGIQLTRDGRFQISNDGYLITEDGSRVQGKQGDINIRDYMLDNNQQVSVTPMGEIKIGDKVVDQLSIVEPLDEQNLTRTGGQMFIPVDGYALADQTKFTVRQGYVEGSNVNPIQEMQDMIQVNSDYQSAQKMMNYLDQSLAEANQAGKV